MGVSFQQIIATVNPNLYYDASGDKDEAREDLGKFKELIKEKGHLIAAEKAKTKPLSKHKLTYECFSEFLEPLYYFILDLMQDDFGFSVEKLVDNFSATLSASNYSDSGQRKTFMQSQSTQMLQNVQNSLRSILNLLYDLRDFKMRLKLYEDLKNPEEEKKQAALLGLKQVWMDKVDMQKGRGSINMLSSDLSFVTLRDSFMKAKNVKDADSFDLNERIKRMLIQRINEFDIWLEHSKEELDKRYTLEKNYLKTQVNQIKLQMKWLKPYLLAAEDLEFQDLSKNPDFVKSFNRNLVQVMILGTRPVSIDDQDDVPKKLRDYKEARKYYTCVLINFRFRAAPTQQHSYIGRMDVTFESYSLNKQELEKAKFLFEKTDLKDSLRLIEGVNQDDMKFLEEEINEFLDEEKKPEEKGNKEIKNTADLGLNPFSALIGKYNSPEGSKKEDSDSIWHKLGMRAKKQKWEVDKNLPEPENWVEKGWLRPKANDDAIDSAFNLFNIYKKGHGMATYI